MNTSPMRPITLTVGPASRAASAPSDASEGNDAPLSGRQPTLLSESSLGPPSPLTGQTLSGLTPVIEVQDDVARVPNSGLAQADLLSRSQAALAPADLEEPPAQYDPDKESIYSASGPEGADDNFDPEMQMDDTDPRNTIGPFEYRSSLKTVRLLVWRVVQTMWLGLLATSVVAFHVAFMMSTRSSGGNLLRALLVERRLDVSISQEEWGQLTGCMIYRSTAATEDTTCEGYARDGGLQPCEPYEPGNPPEVYTHWNWRSRSIEYVQSPLYAAAGGFWHIRHWQILEHVLQVLLLGITAKLLFPHRWSAGVHLLFWVPQVLFKVWTLLALFGVDYVYLTWDGWVVGFGVFVIFYAQLLIINCVIPCEQRPFRTKKQMVIFIGVFVLVFVAVAGSQFIADQLRGTIPDILYIVMCLSASVLATLALLTSSQWLPHVPMPFIVACIFANQLWFHIRQRVFVKELGYSNLTNVWTLSVVLFFMEVLSHGLAIAAKGWWSRRNKVSPESPSPPENTVFILTVVTIASEQLALYRTFIHTVVRDPALFDVAPDVKPYEPFRLGRVLAIFGIMWLLELLADAAIIFTFGFFNNAPVDAARTRLGWALTLGMAVTALSCFYWDMGLRWACVECTWLSVGTCWTG